VPYIELEPTAALRPWVECFWTRNDEAPSDVQRVLPDGCADLVFDLRKGSSAVVGTMTKPLLLPPHGSFEFFGVRFRPGRAAAFLRIPLAEITDARVPLGEIWRSWSDGLLERPVSELIITIESELLRRLDPERDRRVDAAIARMVVGHVRIDELAREIGISRQHLARQFLHHVGVSPKTFARVMRFRRLADSLSGIDVDWADAAAEHGFYDQSHLIADFRELAGTTPNAFHFSNR
jgi:AraC-like DNA-binding protein